MDYNIIIVIGLGVCLGGMYVVKKYCNKKVTKLRYIRYRPLSEAV